MIVRPLKNKFTATFHTKHPLPHVLKSSYSYYGSWEIFVLKKSHKFLFWGKFHFEFELWKPKVNILQTFCYCWNRNWEDILILLYDMIILQEDILILLEDIILLLEVMLILLEDILILLKNILILLEDMILLLELYSTYHPTFFSAGGPLLRTLCKPMPLCKITSNYILGVLCFCNLQFL